MWNRECCLVSCCHSCLRRSSDDCGFSVKKCLPAWSWMSATSAHTRLQAAPFNSDNLWERGCITELNRDQAPKAVQGGAATMT
eukprot:3733277-Amphidinium_carterae.2